MDNLYQVLKLSGTLVSGVMSLKKESIFDIEDIDKLKESILVVHNHKDNLLKQTKRKLKIRNKIQYDKLGNVIYVKGQGIRGSLHQDTFSFILSIAP